MTGIINIRDIDQPLRFNNRKILYPFPAGRFAASSYCIEKRDHATLQTGVEACTKNTLPRGTGFTLTDRLFFSDYVPVTGPRPE